MARETMASIRKALAEERQRGEAALAKAMDHHQQELAHCEQQLAAAREENARLKATLGIVRAALDQVTADG